MSVQLIKHKFTVDDYSKMAEMGVLKEGDRVELIRGEIIEMSPIGTRHAACVARLINLFMNRLGKSSDRMAAKSHTIRQQLSTSTRCNLAATPG